MKLFALLAFVGLAAASYEAGMTSALKWESGHEYVYSYSGRLLTGIPQLNEHHFSGLGIKCQVRLQVRPDNRIVLQVVAPEYKRVNEKLVPVTGDQKGENWRWLPINSYTPVPEESKRLLEKPSMFVINESGKVSSLKVHADEPEWSINFKKALVSLFQTGTMESSVEVPKEIREMERKTPAGEYVPRVWTTYEESTDGECETKYELVETPKSMVASDIEGENLLPMPKLCPNSEDSKIYELIKVRNLNNCPKSAVFSSYKPGFFSCSTNPRENSGTCGGMFTRNSITRYTVCGSPDRFLVQSIVNEGEIHQNLMGYKTEKVLTGTRQVLKLVRKSSIESRISEEGSIVLSTLMYQYTETEGRDAMRQMSSNLIRMNGEPIEKEKLIHEVEELIKEVVHRDLFTPEGLPEKEISMKVLTAAAYFRLFDKTMLSKVYENIMSSGDQSEEGKEILKNILVDTIVMSGTPESIKFFKHLVERNELAHSQVSAIFFNLPRTIITPTRHVLEELFELVKSEPVRQETSVWSNAVLSYSKLLQKVCLSADRHVSYPTAVFGKFCSRDSAILTEKWIPYLQREMTESNRPEKKNTVIVALGMLSHEQILPVLLPVIEEEYIENENNAEIHTSRLLAVYSLVEVGVYHPHRVLPVLSAIMTNKAEPSEIRIAAFNVLIGLKPDMVLLQKIAAMTWVEKDSELLRTINTAFYTLANQVSMQDFKPSTSILIRRVRLVYPLIKKTCGRTPSSATIFTNEMFEQLNTGYEMLTHWTGAKDSILPTLLFTKINYFEDEYTYSPLTAAISLRGMAPRLYDALSGTASKPVEEIKNKLTGEWREAVEKLRIKVRDNSSPEAFILLSVFEDSTLFRTFSKSAEEEVVRALRNPALLTSYLSGEKRFNYQRTFDLMPMEGIIPTDLGLPVFTGLKMPTVVSLQGKINGETSLKSGKMDVEFKSVVDTRVTGFVSTICPFTGEYIVTGVDQHATVSLPFGMSVHANLPEGELKVKLNLHKETSSPVEFLYYRVLPFTAVQKYFNMKPIVKSENLKEIKSNTPEETGTFAYGEYIGLNLVLHWKTESATASPVATMLKKLYQVNYNPINYFRFLYSSLAGVSPTGLPSLRKHEVKLVFHPESTSSQGIEFNFKLGVGTKEKEQPIKYHKLEVEAESQRPMKVVSKPIGEHAGQVRRQEKIKNILEKLAIDTEGRAATLMVSTTVLGSRPRTYTYSATFGTGQAGLKQKWDLKLTSETSSQAVCVRGDIEIPSFSIWKLSEIRSEEPVFHYQNTIGYGNECSESQIVVKGYAKTSEMQKKLAKETPEAKEYNRLVEKRTPMIKLSELAEIVRRQSSIIDEYHYKLDFVNVGSKVMVVPVKALEFIQIYWLPYWRPTSSLTQEEKLPISRIEISRNHLSGVEAEKSFTIEVRTLIHSARRTFDVELSSTKMSEEVVEPTALFKDIPISYPVEFLFPVSYIHDPVSIVAKKLTGKPLYPVCTLEARHISSFDNKTIKAEIDDCFHLLSGDCSKDLQYGVLVRSLSSRSEEEEKKEVKIFVEEVEITMKPEGEKVEVKVDGRPIEVPKTEKKQIKNREGKIVAEVIKTKDNVVIVKSAKVSVYFDGKLIKLEGSMLLKNKLCGLCGDNNNQKVADIVSPRMCLLSKPELLVASWRVGSLPSKKCEPLPENIKAKLEKEEQMCVRPAHQHTKVVEAYHRRHLESGEGCMNQHHEIVDKYTQKELCFSRIPILECGYNCHPVGVREKTVGFTCMPKDRKSEHIAEKIRRGEVLSELRNLPVSYSVKRSIPVECKSPSAIRGF